jgi:hypothetical protein
MPRYFLITAVSPAIVSADASALSRNNRLADNTFASIQTDLSALHDPPHAIGAKFASATDLDRRCCALPR